MKWIIAEEIEAPSDSIIPPDEAIAAVCTYATEGYYYRLERMEGRWWRVRVAWGRAKRAPWWMYALLEKVGRSQAPIVEHIESRRTA